MPPSPSRPPPPLLPRSLPNHGSHCAQVRVASPPSSKRCWASSSLVLFLTGIIASPSPLLTPPPPACCMLIRASHLNPAGRQRPSSEASPTGLFLAFCLSRISMVSQAEASAPRLRKNYVDQSRSEDVVGQSNMVYCQRAPLYANGEETAASTLVTLAEEAKLATAEVKAPGNAIVSVCKSLVAGGVAGGVSRSAVAPLERLKILLQVQNPLNPKYNGMIHGLKYIWRTEGLRGFFKGNGTNCARIIPNSAVKFYSYEQASSAILWLYRHHSGYEDAELSPLLRLGAGACAGIIAMSATYPMDMVRGRLTVQTADSPRQYRGMFHAVSTVAREEGPRALYKGWLPSVIGVIPYVGLNFAVYESLKDWIIKQEPFGPIENSELSVMTKLACGAAAGTVGQTVAYPLDVIRRRMQMIGWKDASPVITADGKLKGPVQYTGMVDAFRHTVKNEGLGALYKGLVPNSVKVVPSIALAFVTYEVVKDLLGVEFRISD